MRRRNFITLLCSALLCSTLMMGSLTAHAQQSGGMRRIGVLMSYPETDPDAQAFLAAFREGLQKLGWTEGKNVRLDTRWATAGNASMASAALKNEIFIVFFIFDLLSVEVRRSGHMRRNPLCQEMLRNVAGFLI